ncbi:HNH endonuclease [Nostoc sp. CHAB 5715]|uniref:HNH endonuclease n=1 Tax=Nostoc sp. CHAB 5715 TaxID=2780400 RepID=UPI001E47F7C1|nr:HNH endonuclease signature motif containing protein [Nostoc sp. CHAB 5715]MCC5620122.1 HNH endonuclease [Nostoc sp. CHAB 5715]
MAYSAFQVIELHHSLLPTPHSPSHLWSKYLKNAVSCQVDHIISVKHGGATTPDNLCYACIFCNLQKGTDLGSINWQTGELVRFFNPRRDFWGEHFRLDEAVIVHQTDIGEVTARILDFNGDERLVERQALIASGQHPSASALKQINK